MYAPPRCNRLQHRVPPQTSQVPSCPKLRLPRALMPDLIDFSLIQPARNLRREKLPDWAVGDK
jgi:hypothetical protein